MLTRLPHLLTAACLLLATPALANLPSPDSDCMDASECDPCPIPSCCSPGETGMCITECHEGDDDSAGDEDDSAGGDDDDSAPTEECTYTGEGTHLCLQSLAACSCDDFIAQTWLEDCEAVWDCS